LHGRSLGGVVFGITSCVQSYTVGYIYVTGTSRPRPVATASSPASGSITTRADACDQWPACFFGWRQPGARRSHPGQPVSLCLNRGVSARAAPMLRNRRQRVPERQHHPVAVGGNGVLTAQEIFYTRAQSVPAPLRHLGQLSSCPGSRRADSGVTTLVNGGPDELLHVSTDRRKWRLLRRCYGLQDRPNHGRLSLVENSQVTAANGSPITYFPVPANPSTLFSLAPTCSPSPARRLPPPPTPTPAGPRSGLQLRQQRAVDAKPNGVQGLGIHQGTAIVNASGVIYVLDNEPVTVTFGGTSTTSKSQILPLP